MSQHHRGAEQRHGKQLRRRAGSRRVVRITQLGGDTVDEAAIAVLQQRAPPPGAERAGHICRAGEVADLEEGPGERG